MRVQPRSFRGLSPSLLVCAPSPPVPPSSLLYDVNFFARSSKVEAVGGWKGAEEEREMAIRRKGWGQDDKSMRNITMRVQKSAIKKNIISPAANCFKASSS